MTTRPLLLPLALAALLLAPADARAEPETTLTPPVLKGIVLDGTPTEAGWAQGAKLAFPAVAVPLPAQPAPVEIAPSVRCGIADGRLVFAVSMAEDPGTSIGMHLMIARPKMRSAAEAISIDFRPASLRAPRYRCIGPEGTGRAHFRIEGRAVTTDAGRWTLECGVPLADLSGGAKGEPLRMAAVVYTRTPNVITAFPKGAVWKGPKHWVTLTPPEGGWPLAAQVNAKRIAVEDKDDAARQAFWLQYLKGAATPVLPVKATREILKTIEEGLLEPLRTVMVARPDLEPGVRCIQGDIYQRLGFRERAGEEYRQVLDGWPGWREAAYGLYVKVRGDASATAPPGAATDYARMRAALDATFDEGEYPAVATYVRDGRRLAEALIAYKEGKVDAALAPLTQLAARYPFDALIDAHRRMAIRAKRSTGEEALRVKQDAKKSLPRATVETTNGTFELELFHDDARNTVANFVWLAQHGFYNDCAVHRTVPGFLAQTGDPHTRTRSAKPRLVGSGTPGYAIRTEGGNRRALRGYVALANAGPNTDGSQFMLFTGTAVHLQGEVTVFARVVKGMEVVDGLRAGETPHRITKVSVTGLDPERAYHPSTLSGNRAPKPK